MVQLSPNYAALAFASQFTNLKKAYIHKAPSFTVRYPDGYDVDQPLDADQVFLAKNRYGLVPVLTISVVPAEPDMNLSKMGSYYASRLRRHGNQVRIVSNRAVRLSDGTKAFETKIAWMYQRTTKLNSLALSTFCENKLVNVAIHHTGEIDDLKHIPYSLSFK